MITYSTELLEMQSRNTKLETENIYNYNPIRHREKSETALFHGRETGVPAAALIEHSLVHLKGRVYEEGLFVASCLFTAFVRRMQSESDDS